MSQSEQIVRLSPTGSAAVSERSDQELVFPAAIVACGQRACEAFLEYFTANIRNRNTRLAYLRAITDFLAWSTDQGLELERIQPWHVAAFIESLGREKSEASVKQHLAALRRFCDHLVVRQVLEFNPATSVRGPKLVVREGKTPILWEEDLTQLFSSFDLEHVIGRRDRAVITVMFYTFARVGAVTRLRVKDFQMRGAKAILGLQEKGGVHNPVVIHPACVDHLTTYLELAHIADDPNGPLFRSTRGRSRRLTSEAMSARDIQRMVKRRCSDTGLPADISPHSFRGSGITIFRKNGGSLETAQLMAGHASARTTQIYDHHRQALTVEEIALIRLHPHGVRETNS